MGANARSTVGTATDAYTMLRLDLQPARRAVRRPSSLFSFNDPQGMCPSCEGMGRVSTVDVDEMVDRAKSLDEGAITLPNFGVDSWSGACTPSRATSTRPRGSPTTARPSGRRSCTGTRRRSRSAGLNLKCEGLVHRFERTFLSKDVETAQPHIRAAIERVATFAPCPECGGARLNQAALAAKIDGRNIAECAAMQVDDLAPLPRRRSTPRVSPPRSAPCATRSTASSRSASAT